jgi:hypothetical protein
MSDWSVRLSCGSLPFMNNQKPPKISERVFSPPAFEAKDPGVGKEDTRRIKCPRDQKHHKKRAKSDRARRPPRSAKKKFDATKGYPGEGPCYCCNEYHPADIDAPVTPCHRDRCLIEGHVHRKALSGAARRFKEEEQKRVKKRRKRAKFELCERLTAWECKYPHAHVSSDKQTVHACQGDEEQRFPLSLGAITMSQSLQYPLYDFEDFGCRRGDPDPIDDLFCGEANYELKEREEKCAPLCPSVVDADDWLAANHEKAPKIPERPSKFLLMQKLNQLTTVFVPPTHLTGGDEAPSGALVVLPAQVFVNANEGEVVHRVDEVEKIQDPPPNPNPDRVVSIPFEEKEDAPMLRREKVRLYGKFTTVAVAQKVRYASLIYWCMGLCGSKHQRFTESGSALREVVHGVRDSDRIHVKACRCCRPFLSRYKANKWIPGPQNIQESPLFRGMYPSCYEGLVYIDVVKEALADPFLSKYSATRSDESVNGNIVAGFKKFFEEHACFAEMNSDQEVLANTYVHLTNQMVARSLLLGSAVHPFRENRPLNRDNGQSSLHSLTAQYSNGVQ